MQTNLVEKLSKLLLRTLIPLNIGGVQIDLVCQIPFPELPAADAKSKTAANSTLEPVPDAPDYALPANWAGTSRKDSNIRLAGDDYAARLVRPNGRKSRRLSRLPDSLQADVFFIHPTMLLEGERWNADVQDVNMNEEVDRWPVRHQASAFSGAGRVFVPRYRQAHVRVFRRGDSLSWAAVDLAFTDVKRAFLHYMEHWNQGRPFVLAGHSQGSFHGRMLLQEVIEGAEFRGQLVAAYLPGMDMYASEFKEILPCAEAGDVGCLCTWMSYGEGYLPPWLVQKQSEPNSEPLLCTHPVLWGKGFQAVDADQNDEADACRAAHSGVVRPTFKLSKKRAISAYQVGPGVLWLRPPHVLGGRLLQRENWHSGDLNLFWANVFENVQTRTANWHERQKH
ncbi:MAG: DUF3089 domain-containing protein [Flavobacteriales bacterium]